MDITEQIDGDFGVTVRYHMADDNNCVVDFFAAEVCGRDDQGALYWGKGANSFPSDNDARALEEAERYLAGSVKWDGCSHVDFGNENGYLHICGKADVDKLATTLSAIHVRCGELMQAAGTKLLEGEF